jgi:hypothetical protein
MEKNYLQNLSKFLDKTQQFIQKQLSSSIMMKEDNSLIITGHQLLQVLTKTVNLICQHGERSSQKAIWKSKKAILLGLDSEFL